MNEHGSPDRIAWRLRSSDKVELHPVVVRRDDVAQQRGRRIDIVDHDVDAPIVKQIAKSCAPGCQNGAEATILDGRHKRKLAIEAQRRYAAKERQLKQWQQRLASTDDPQYATYIRKQILKCEEYLEERKPL